MIITNRTVFNTHKFEDFVIGDVFLVPDFGDAVCMKLNNHEVLDLASGGVCDISWLEPVIPVHAELIITNHPNTPECKCFAKTV